MRLPASRAFPNLPEGGLAFTTLLATGSTIAFTWGGALEARSGSLGLASHGLVSRRSGASGIGGRFSSAMLVLERVKILERHG